jgi:predicted component of type VI protein secretion system
MIAANSNIAAAVVALLVKKGGTLRLRKSELAEVGDLVITVQLNPENPEVLHFGIAPKAEYEAMMAVAALLQTPPAKEPDASGK